MSQIGVVLCFYSIRHYSNLFDFFCVGILLLGKSIEMQMCYLQEGK